MSESPAHAEELQRAVVCARAHADGRALGALVYGVLGVQAEGRALFAGQKFMAQRAEQHGVDAARAATELGNVLAILERGPADRQELALLSAFAARGAAEAIAAAQGDERRARADKLVGELDWLELATRYRVASCLLAQLDPACEPVLVAALVDAVLRDDRLSQHAGPEVFAARARNALRLSVIGQCCDRDACADALGALARVRAEAQDSATRSLCAALCGELPAVATPAERVFGCVARGTRRPVVAALRWITGYALLHALASLVGFLLRVRREVELSFDGRVLRERRRTHVLGRVVRSREAIHAVDGVWRATRTGRYALARTLLGAFMLCAGVLVGGYFGGDAARGGASTLLALAAAGCAFGVGADLVLDLLGPALRGEVQLQIELAAARPIVLAKVPLEQADRLLAALEQRMGARAK